MKPILISLGATVLLIGGIAWFQNAKNNDPNLISSTGIHWHPQLEIYVKGEKQEITQGIGLTGAVHQPMHTHEDLPLVHMEFQGRVTKENTQLGEFFRIWGKTFNEFGQNVTMTVNSEPNTELAEYQMKDGDKIELRYE